MVSGDKSLNPIIEDSISLFNLSGVSDVTTNHIARHLNIRPGNLCYYFANMEAIIRTIFAQINPELETQRAGRDQQHVDRDHLLARLCGIGAWQGSARAVPRHTESYRVPVYTVYRATIS